MNEWHTSDPVQKQDDGCRVPSRDVGKEPPLERRQIPPRTEVLYQQNSANRPFQREIVIEGTLWYGDLPKDFRDGREIYDTMTSWASSPRGGRSLTEPSCVVPTFPSAASLLSVSVAFECGAASAAAVRRLSRRGKVGSPSAR